MPPSTPWPSGQIQYLIQILFLALSGSLREASIYTPGRQELIPPKGNRERRPSSLSCYHRRHLQGGTERKVLGLTGIISSLSLADLARQAHSEDVNSLCQSKHSSWGTSTQPPGESNDRSPQAAGDE